ncbi:MAG: hypothetical protein ABS939_17945 [Psychrobacillus sp.]
MILVSVFLLGVIIIFNLSKGDMNFFFESMKFLFSVVAAYVGIRAVRNSTKSVDIATESIRVTKEKELREQSSHLIVASIIDKFPFNAPLYKEKNSHIIPDESEGVTAIREKFPAGGFEKPVVDFISKTRLNYANKILENRYISESDLHKINIINNGKGSSVNIMYEFTFENISEFIDYQIPFPIERNSITAMYPSYQLKVIEMNKFYVISISDNHLLDYLDPTNLEKPFVSYYSSRDYHYYKNRKNIEYKSYLNPTDKMEVTIPNEFMILCKHYVIQYFYKNNIDSIYSLVKDRVQPLIDSPLIKPKGKITVSFYDESLIRTGEYSPEQRTVLEYEVGLKDEAIKKINNNEISFYLEVNLSKSETNFNSKREPN